MGSRPVSSFSVDVSVQTPTRSAVLHDAATQLPLTEFFIGCIYSNSPLDRQNLFVSLRHQCRIQMVYLNHRLDLNSQSLPLSLLLIRTCSPMLAALPAIPSCRLSVPHMWKHPVRTVSSAKRSASTAPAGTHNPLGFNLRTDADFFPKPKAVILPMVNFGHPQSKDPAPLPQQSISPFPLTVESRPSAQKSLQHRLCRLR